MKNSRSLCYSVVHANLLFYNLFTLTRSRAFSSFVLPSHPNLRYSDLPDIYNPNSAPSREPSNEISLLEIIPLEGFDSHDSEPSNRVPIERFSFTLLFLFNDPEEVVILAKMSCFLSKLIQIRSRSKRLVLLRRLSLDFRKWGRNSCEIDLAKEQNQSVSRVLDKESRERQLMSLYLMQRQIIKDNSLLRDQQE